MKFIFYKIKYALKIYFLKRKIKNFTDQHYEIKFWLESEKEKINPHTRTNQNLKILEEGEFLFLESHDFCS